MNGQVCLKIGDLGVLGWKLAYQSSLDENIALKSKK